jgi:hypothetical protein
MYNISIYEIIPEICSVKAISDHTLDFTIFEVFYS